MGKLCLFLFEFYIFFPEEGDVVLSFPVEDIVLLEGKVLPGRRA